MENPFAESLEGLDFPNYDRLSFEEQCGFYAALLLTRPESRDKPFRSLPTSVVADAAGVGTATISHLKAAGQVRSGQIRYPRVAAEFAKLGKDAFTKKYLSPLIRDRVEVAIAAYRHKKLNPDINAQGFNPRADRYCRRYDWPETSIGLHAVFVIHLATERAGYVWRNLKPRQDLPELEMNQTPLEGDPERDGKGFATSEDCFRWVKNRLDPKL